jgi:L-seryl-tRNA(Ser) seleniumtransferase
MIAAPAAELEARARRLAAALAARGLSATVVAGVSTTGGGASPLSALPTSLVAVTSARHSAAAIEARLRRHRPPVIARIEDDRILLDLRTVGEDEEDAIVAAFP